MGFTLSTNVAETDAQHAATLLRCARELLHVIGQASRVNQLVGVAWSCGQHLLQTNCMLISWHCGRGRPLVAGTGSSDAIAAVQFCPAGAPTVRAAAGRDNGSEHRRHH